MKSFIQYLEESPASEAATRLGLDYYGFGRYGKHSTVTHHSEFGRLVQVKQEYHQHKGEGELKHLEHLEDAIFNHGVAGVRSALDTLHALDHYFQGKDDRIKLGVKIDGAPSVVMGKNPVTNKFFVATKSAFNANPKVNYTDADIEENHGHAPGLMSKLKDSLKYLRKLNPKYTHQGDLLYTKDDIKIETVNGEDHYTFKPNTIKYAVPVDSDMGRKIARSKIGIAVHTKYHPEGGRFPSEESDLEDHPDVFMLSTDVPTIKSEEMYGQIQQLGGLISNTPRDVFDYVSKPEIKDQIKQYINSTVRLNTTPSGNDFVKFVNDKMQKDIDKLKTEKGKTLKQLNQRTVVAELNNNLDKISRALQIHSFLASVKQNAINVLNKNQKIKHFLDTPDGMIETSPEGYVVLGVHGSHKLVNRQEFSRSNFLAPKDWK